MEDEAGKVADFHRLRVADVHEDGPVEGALAGLLDHEDLVVELLPLEDRVHVEHEQFQVFRSVPGTEILCSLF